MGVKLPAVDLSSFKLSGFNFPKLPPAAYYTLGVVAGVNVALALFFNLRTRRYRIRKSLEGQVVVITGGTSGIGKACVIELAKHGATIHILARDLKRAEMVVEKIKKETGNANIFIHFCNLSDFTTVRMFAKKFLATDSKIDILINNAGLFNMTRKVTVDGLEETLQANYLSHFLLTNLLLERVISSSPSRIINVSSAACNYVSDFDVRDMNLSKRAYGSFLAYAWTKFEMVMWTKELARKLYGKGVSVNSLHPGGVRTSIMRDISIFSWMTPLLMIGWGMAISPFLGAQTLLYLAESEETKNVSGHYFDNCRPAPLIVEALDDQLAAELWWESEQLTRRMK